MVANVALVAMLGLAACSKPSAPGDVKVTDITTGRAIASNGAIVDDARTMMFWTNDTFYVSVVTEGSADNVTMQARWTGPDGKVAAESSKTIAPKGTTVTAFEAPPPKTEDGKWPPGDYKVEILVNGASQGTREMNARS